MNEKYLSLLREIHSSTTDIRSSTIVIGFSNDEYNDIAKVYSSKSKYCKGIINSWIIYPGLAELVNAPMIQVGSTKCLLEVRVLHPAYKIFVNYNKTFIMGFTVFLILLR